MIFTSIRYNLANLLRFSGRDSRALFWPYAIAIFLLKMTANILLIIPLLVDTMTRTMAYVQTHPGGLPRAAPGQPPVLPPELMPDMRSLVWPMSAVSLVGISLMAAAVVRRLHDRDKSSWWAAIPLPFQIYGMVAAPLAARKMTFPPPPPSALTTFNSLNGALSLAALLFLVVLLVGNGTPGANRFGDAPAG